MKSSTTAVQWKIKLQKLQDAGYTVEYNWVKGGGIGHMFYLQRKRIYRLQISATELRGKYHMAWCVVIPAIVPATKKHTIFILNNNEVF